MSPGYDPRWDNDVRSHDAETDRPDLNRGGRAGTDPRERRDVDPRDVFMENLSLPRGPEREHVYVHEHTYRLRGSETRTLAAVGVFRVVDVSDLRDHQGREADPRNGDLWNLREQGLLKTMPAARAGKRRRDPHRPRTRAAGGIARRSRTEWPPDLLRGLLEAARTGSRLPALSRVPALSGRTA
jgi:hypothetical protein